MSWIAALLIAFSFAGPSSATAAAVNPTAQARPAAAAPVAAHRGGTVVRAQRSRFGTVLFDGSGRALYLFTRERGPSARCYGACAAAWPPALTSGRPRAGRGAQGRRLGTTRRRDGTRQVTYAGHPLYYYVGDRGPGQINCQDVVEFGGTWLIVAPSGRAVR